MRILLSWAFLGTLALAAFTGCNTAQTGGSRGALALFNGQDLAGWQHVLAEPGVPRDAVWSVRDGLIICRGTPLGVLQTERAFTNFVLVVEYRWAPGSAPGNSGLLTRINGPARALPRCVEVQLMHGNAGDVLGLQGMSVASGQPRYFEVMNHAVAGDIRGVKKLSDAERPGGEWNRVELFARGGDYTVWMNGRQINQAKGVAAGSGPVGLQSEGGEIHFRRVTLTPLAD
jgi:Domain of Unknown Function (DUF1080)